MPTSTHEQGTKIKGDDVGINPILFQGQIKLI